MTSEITEQALSLDALPDSLYNELEANLQNAVKLEESTYSDLFSISTINDDGTKSIMSFNNPVKYYDETGDICFIDNAFVSAADDNDIAFENSGNSYNAQFPVNINDGVVFSESNFSITMKPINVVENCSPQIINNELVYRKPGREEVTNLRLDCNKNAIMSSDYLTNENIKRYATDNTYDTSLRFFIITKDAVSDYPHGDRSATTQNPLYFTDMAGDNMFASSNISTGIQDGCIDTCNDVDYFVFNSTTTQNYTIATSSYKKDKNGVTRNVNSYDLNCEIYDYNGNLIRTDAGTGQVDIEINFIAGKKYFIKIYSTSGSPCDYALILL